MMESTFYSTESVAHLYDEVLACCIIEFRQALGMLERSGLKASNTYAEEMKRGLTTMEAELTRRNLHLVQRRNGFIELGSRSAMHTPAPTAAN